MFKHNLKYSLKILLKNKSLIFWTFVFPILLGTLFKMAFSNIENSETLKIIDIAIVNDTEFNNDVTLKETIKYLSDETNEDKLILSMLIKIVLISYLKVMIYQVILK